MEEEAKEFGNVRRLALLALKMEEGNHGFKDINNFKAGKDKETDSLLESLERKATLSTH